MSSVPMVSSSGLAGLSLLRCEASSGSLSSPRNSDCTSGGESRTSCETTERSDSPAPHRALLPQVRPVHASSCNGQSRSDATPSKPASEELLRRQLNRIREVREQQGISIRSVAKRVGIDVRRYRELEDPYRDLMVSELHAVQAALDVPLCDLLVDRDGLSRPVAERAQLVKTMKSAVAIREAKSNPRVQRLATMLCEQLVELMPELREVSGWPQFGARRGASALGRALQQPIDTTQIISPD